MAVGLLRAELGGRRVDPHPGSRGRHRGRDGPRAGRAGGGVGQGGGSSTSEIIRVVCEDGSRVEVQGGAGHGPVGGRVRPARRRVPHGLRRLSPGMASPSGWTQLRVEEVPRYWRASLGRTLTGRHQPRKDRTPRRFAAREPLGCDVPSSLVRSIIDSARRARRRRGRSRGTGRPRRPAGRRPPS